MDKATITVMKIHAANRKNLVIIECSFFCSMERWGLGGRGRKLTAD